MPAESFTWVECPRDAWQSLDRHIPARRKREHLKLLLDAGFTRLDLGSFVSPRAVPQMADTEEVLAGLERPEDADFLCIIANERGLARAVAAPNVTSVGYPLSVNETFQLRNTGRDLQSSWELVGRLARDSRESGLQLVVYLSMGFGNPYGEEEWSPGQTAAAAARLADLGVNRVALADTVGNADAALVSEVVAAVEFPGELGLHLHAHPDGWRETVEAAWAAGVRWFEGALAGLGGCPFAHDELVGNLPTELVLPHLLELAGQPAGETAAALPRLAADAAAIAREYGAPLPRTP